MAEGILGLVGVVAADSLVAAGDVVVLAETAFAVASEASPQAALRFCPRTPLQCSESL